MSTYTVNGVTYSAETGLPVEINEGPSPITSEKPVGVLDGSVVRNKNGTVKNYRFGQTKPYELWSNEDGSSWSIREPVSVDGGTGLFPSEITKSGGTTIVRDGVKTIGYENFLTDELYNKATDTIQTKTRATTLKGVIPTESPSRRDELRAQGFTDKDIDDIFNEEALLKVMESSDKYKIVVNKDGKKLVQAVGSAETTEEGDKGFGGIKFGKVDKIIKKLSLRNLVYPIDADFGNTQDYMQINQFTYRAPNKDIFFTKTKDKPDSAGPGSIITDGLQMGTPREDFLGLVKLPMPNSLADSNNVSWGADQLNALTAAVSSAVFGQGEQIVDALGAGIEGFGQGGNLVQKIRGFFNPLIDQGKLSANQGAEEFAKIKKAITTEGSSLNILGKAVAGSALLNIGQFGITPESILARGQGVVPNNNLALLFNSPTLREFTFSWKMSPRSREEATRIRNIIRFFKQGMAPKKGFGTATGAASYFLGTPNVFDIVFKTTRDKYGILNENDSVLRIKTCACTGTAVNYTPDGMWNAYEQGQPVSVTLSLRFAELEPIFDTDYDENEFNYSPDRKDLRPVPIDAIGY